VSNVVSNTSNRRLQWSDQQRQALEAIDEWLAADDWAWFYLAGYAGTGKSTLAAEVAWRCGGNVVFGAYTGKAAAVMREKGCVNADTIDALIYKLHIEPSCAADWPCDPPHCGNSCRHFRGRHVGRELNYVSDVAGADLVIIDEVSMVGEAMARDLLSFGIKVLVLGDVAQLPPIGDAGYFTSHRPDFQLTQIHRQALGSPIIELATRARQGKTLQRRQYGTSVVLENAKIDELLDYEQVIVGTHRTRHRINDRMRQALGFAGDTPERGERIICLKNNRRKGLLNGTFWDVVRAIPLSDGFIEMLVRGDSGAEVDVVAPEEGFTSFDGAGSDLPGEPIAFGYAITCHKAQGSQWHSLCVIDESTVFREHCDSWLYTAITRAVDCITVVP
jgi:ATP-dependent exoDNAse (exonuclease V) alpha subunit